MQTDLHEIQADLQDLERIAGEITEFTGTAPAEVWQRLALELHSTGYNVVREARRFGVTPHQFDNRMVEFYTHSDGFIYETSVESVSANRRAKWRQCVDFLLAHADAAGRRVLVYGDSVGSDSIFLQRLGFEVYYHDFESLCSRFAHWRFTRRGLDIKDFSAAPAGTRFDFVLCLEVAEHTPDPVGLVRELGTLIQPGGFCLFSEGFKLLRDNFPTHLRENVRYVGQADALFAKEGLHVFWRDRDDKPIIYARRPTLRRFLYRPGHGFVSRLLRRIARGLPTTGGAA